MIIGAWHYEKSGIFSVRSAYRKCWYKAERQPLAWEEDMLGRSDTRVQQNEWCELWKIKVSSKIRIFLWHLATLSIPTGDVRHRRNMRPDRGCSLFGGDDSWRHALLECNLAKCVWALERDEIIEFICQVQSYRRQAVIGVSFLCIVGPNTGRAIDPCFRLYVYWLGSLASSMIQLSLCSLQTTRNKR